MLTHAGGACGEKVVFGSWEASLLCNSINMYTSILEFSEVMAESAATAGWLRRYTFNYINYNTCNFISCTGPFMEKTLILASIYCRQIGKIVVGLVLMAHFVFIVATMLREFSED